MNLKPELLVDVTKTCLQRPAKQSPKNLKEVKSSWFILFCYNIEIYSLQILINYFCFHTKKWQKWKDRHTDRHLNHSLCHPAKPHTGFHNAIYSSNSPSFFILGTVTVWNQYILVVNYDFIENILFSIKQHSFLGDQSFEQHLKNAS